MAEQDPNFDLENRTFEFALSVRRCLKGVQWEREQWNDVDQLLRSSGSVAANYTEANNSISRADFNFRIRLCKKEASESRLWLRLLGATTNSDTVKEPLRAIYKESDELVRIFAAILRKTKD
ncbi:MAG: four helix bundle protein [Verrucomicrobiota bacterium JB025]|nr:four helix bundle protein [Verrucomicrobiota bacterium JB025]